MLIHSAYRLGIQNRYYLKCQSCLKDWLKCPQVWHAGLCRLQMHTRLAKPHLWHPDALAYTAPFPFGNDAGPDCETIQSWRCTQNWEGFSLADSCLEKQIFTTLVLHQLSVKPDATDFYSTFTCKLSK